MLIFNLIDTLYIGRLGSTELAAIGFCFPVIFALSSIAFGLATGSTAVMSQAIGRGDMAAARSTATNSLVLTVIITSVLGIIGAATINPVFTLLGATPEVMVHIERYMNVFYLGLPAIMAPVAINGFMRATGDTLVPAAVMVAGAAMNALVSPLLVFGLWGLPRLEIAGAAWGTVAARLVMTVASLVIIHYRDKIIDYNWRVLKEFAARMRLVLAIGLPAVATQIITPLSAAVLTRLLAGWGQDTVAAFAIGARLESLFLIPLWALQGGVGPFVGQNFGAGRYDRLRETEEWVWKLAISWGTITLLISFFLGKPMSALFTTDPKIIAMSAHYMMWIGAGFIGAGMMLASTAMFNALSRPLLATSVICTRFILLYIPLGILFSRTNGPEGVFAAACISYLGAGVIGAFLIRRTLSRLPQMPSAPPSATPAPADPPPHQHHEAFQETAPEKPAAK